MDFLCLSLKYAQCPHCFHAGALILHGFLYGNHECNLPGKAVRGRRIFCSNRGRRNGCGKTFSVLDADMISNYTIRASSLSSFMSNLLSGFSVFKAFEAVKTEFTSTTIYRIFNKIVKNQSFVRTAIQPFISLAFEPALSNPLFQTIKNLNSVFDNSLCAVSAFQKRFQRSFF